MNLPDLQAEALKLSLADRAQLAEVLLHSLDDVSDEEREALWLAEVRRRCAELDAHPERTVPAAEVFRALRERLG